MKDGQKTVKKSVRYSQNYWKNTQLIQRLGEQSAVKELSVPDLKRKFDATQESLLLDVREPFDFQIAKIPGRKLIPPRDPAPTLT